MFWPDCDNPAIVCRIIRNRNHLVPRDGDGASWTHRLAGQEIASADEFRDEPALWKVVDLGWHSDLFNLPSVHHDNPVRNRQGFFLIVGDKYSGGVQVMNQRPHLVAHVKSQLCIQTREWFVEQENRRMQHKSARQGHTLLLTP